jgi:DNA-binding NarL/FixJ family response regulator
MSADEAPILRLVDAPAAFALRVHAALPDASLIYAERPEHALPRNAGGIAILYQPGVPDRRLIAAMSSGMPTLVVTEDPTTEDALVCLDAGADGYLDAALDTSALRNALLGVGAGEMAYGRDVLGLWLRTRQRKTSLSGVPLTPREREILEMIADGATDKEIAAAFGAPRSTVQKQVARLLRRIGVRNRAAAVAVREGLGA